MFNRRFRTLIMVLPIPVLVLAAVGLSRARQDKAQTAGLEIWRKSLTTGEDTPMRADMLMTQRRHGKTITTEARIVQGPMGKYRMEYQLPKEARGRIVLSDGKSNWQLDPGRKILDKTNMVAMSEQRDRDLERLIESNYAITLVSDKAAAAGRPAYLIDLMPRHAGKSSQRRWIDRTTYKTLRIETHYTDGILARLVSYDHVELPGAVSDADFLPNSRLSVRNINPGASSFYLATNSIPESYASLKLKPHAALGFQLIEISSSQIDNAHAVQLLYSDGIETVSVFAESGAAAVSSIPPNWTKIPIGSETAYQNLDGHLDALTWIHTGYRYSAVSHLVPNALRAFVESQLK